MVSLLQFDGMLRYRFISLFFCVLSIHSLGQDDTKAPKYSNEFLAIGVGARALGMSNAHVAISSDVHSGYWNPAGLAGLKTDLQISAMHAEYFAGIAKYDYAAIAKPLEDNKGTIGLSMIRFGVDNIPNTTELIDAEGNIDYDRITHFSAADYGFLFSYARNLGIEGLTAGGNFKLVHRRVGDFARSWGFGIDLAAKYHKGDWIFAAVARDVTSTFNAWSFDLTDQMVEVFEATDNEIPTNSLELTLPRLVIGATRRWTIKEKFSIQPEVNIDFTFDGKRNTLLKSNFASGDPRVGLELGYKDIVFLRSGIGNIQKIKEMVGKEKYIVQPNLGVGVKIKRIMIDYALTNVSQDIGLYSNVFSLRFDINKPEAKSP